MVVEYNPRVLAEQFANLVISGPVRDTNVTPQRPVYSKQARKQYINGIEGLLEQAPVTPQFREYIAAQFFDQTVKAQTAVFNSADDPEDLVSRLLTGLVASIGTQDHKSFRLKQYAGIDLKNGEYGVFDPEKAKEVERFVLQEEIETFYSQAVQLAPEDQPLRLEHLKQFIGWTEQKYEIGARAEDALKECNAMLRAKTTDAQLQFIKDWAIQFMEFYGEDPFSKEAQNPFYI